GEPPSRRALECTAGWDTQFWALARTPPALPTRICDRPDAERRHRGSNMDAKTGTNTKTGTLSVGDKSWSFPIYPGTIGPDVIDIGKLYAQSGMFTFDPGFTS